MYMSLEMYIYIHCPFLSFRFGRASTARVHIMIRIGFDVGQELVRYFAEMLPYLLQTTN
jgi:hypothetical protein